MDKRQKPNRLNWSQQGLMWVNLLRNCFATVYPSADDPTQKGPTTIPGSDESKNRHALREFLIGLRGIAAVLIKNRCLRHFFRDKPPFFDLLMTIDPEEEDRFKGVVVISALLHVVKRGIREIPLTLCADNQYA